MGNIKDRKTDFPFFDTYPDLVYLDNAATVQKPRVVLEALHDFYVRSNANIGRSTYAVAEMATQRLADARTVIARWLNADAGETVFVPSATQGINMLAYSWQKHVGVGNSIVITQLEHHANYLPWYMLAKRSSATLKIIPVDQHGRLILDDLDTYIDDTTSIIAVSAMSNVTGFPTHLEPIIARAKAVGAKTIVDASQQAVLCPIDVKQMGCDALVFSGHKIGGPTGIGVLYLSKWVQNETPPVFFGGGMVDSVVPSIVLADGVRCYEAGTPPIAQAISLAAAIDYMHSLDSAHVKQRMNELLKATFNGLQAIERVTLVGGIASFDQRHILSFTVCNIHAHDVAAWLDQYGVCVRAGQHCAQPIHDALGLPATIRVSFFVYNDLQDVERLLVAMKKLPYLVC